MKTIQIGILAALVVCAGLLFLVYRNQQAALHPSMTPAVEQAHSVEPATESSGQAAPATPTKAPVAAAASQKPAPSRKAENRGGARSDAPVRMAQAPPAEAPHPPTPEMAQYAPPPVEERPAEALNPPPGEVTATPAPRVPHTATLPAGMAITIRLAETVSTEKNKSGDTFSATVDQPVIVDGMEIASRGAEVVGKVVDAEKAGHVKGLASLSLQLTRIHTSDGQDVPIQTEEYQKQGASENRQSAEKVGGGAVLGAIIGAIAGGGKGAAIGAGAGGAAGGGVAVATHGKPVVLPVETRLSFHLAQAVTLTERIK